MSTPSATANAAVLRPWGQFSDLSAISFPLSIPETSYRISQNLRFFLANYAVLTLLVFLVTLISRPLTLIFFLCIFAAWLYLIFWRDEPLTILDFDVDQKIVFGLLVVMTLVALLWTRVWWKFFLSLIIGAAIVVVHGGCRTPQESMEDSPYGSLLNVVDSPRGEYSSV